MHSRFITLSSQLSCSFRLRNGFERLKSRTPLALETKEEDLFLIPTSVYDIDPDRMLIVRSSCRSLRWSEAKELGVFMNPSLHGKDTLNRGQSVPFTSLPHCLLRNYLLTGDARIVDWKDGRPPMPIQYLALKEIRKFCLFWHLSGERVVKK